MTHSTPPVVQVPAAPGPDSIRILVVGSPQAVENFIHTQHRLGYAEAMTWSPPLPTPHPGQILRILTKRLSLSDLQDS